jgi:hypothetical protein
MPFIVFEVQISYLYFVINIEIGNKRGNRSRTYFLAAQILHIYCYHYCSFILFLWRTYYLSRHYVYIIFFAFNLVVSHRFHVCNSCLNNNISYKIYRYTNDYLHAKFHLPALIKSLGIAIKPIIIEIFVWPPFCCFRLYKSYFSKSCIFILDLLPCLIWGS